MHEYRTGGAPLCGRAGTFRAIVDEPAQAFAGDAVFSMLADDAAMVEVIDAALLDLAERGLVHVNMATISVALAESLARDHAARWTLSGTAAYRQESRKCVSGPAWTGRPNSVEPRGPGRVISAIHPRSAE